MDSQRTMRKKSWWTYDHDGLHDRVPLPLDVTLHLLFLILLVNTEVLTDTKDICDLRVTIRRIFKRGSFSSGDVSFLSTRVLNIPLH